MAVHLVSPPHLAPFPGVEVDERAARATLRRQVALLERRLAALQAESFADPGDRRRIARRGFAWRHAHLQDLEALESARDDLIDRVAQAQVARVERTKEIAETRAFLEEVRRAPERYKFVRIPMADLGEPGCGAYHSRPKLGIIGMLAGWWHVKLSSGCP
ncbi:MAG: hypothetical protein JHC95_08755 [Solirubrobacteraceae bacterium]|nr:hypothetical protein [Solirubrobacteraceae bacterium]